MGKGSQAELPEQESRSTEGSVVHPTEPRFLVVGRVIRPHGVRGEVRVELHTSDPDRFESLASVHIGDPANKPVAITSARRHQDVALVTFDGIIDRDAAEKLRDQWLYIPVEEAAPLAEGEYFLYQLEGLTVQDESGRVLGQLSEVIETGANNVFVVSGPLGDLLLPDIPDVIRDIDFDKGRITVNLLPGLIDPSVLENLEAPADASDSDVATI